VNQHHSIKNQVAWACVLGRDAVVDFRPVLQLAEKATKDYRSYAYARALGAALLRAGKFEAAVQQLHQATTLQADSPSSCLLLGQSPPPPEPRGRGAPVAGQGRATDRGAFAEKSRTPLQRSHPFLGPDSLDRAVGFIVAAP